LIPLPSLIASTSATAAATDFARCLWEAAIESRNWLISRVVDIIL
jgi:hypothetical protein